MACSVRSRPPPPPPPPRLPPYFGYCKFPYIYTYTPLPADRSHL